MKRLIQDNCPLLLIVVTVYSVLFLFGVTCPIKFIFGISCPGCGMTRAFIHILKGDIYTAFYYHPLFCIPFLYLILCIYKKAKYAKYKYILFTILILFLVVYFYRLFMMPSDIVNIDITSGLIFKYFN